MKMKDQFALPLQSAGRDVYGADDFFVATCNNSEDASAAAHAINCHDDLLAALKDARDYVASAAPSWHTRTQEMLAALDAAIAKAEGK